MRGGDAVDGAGGDGLGGRDDLASATVDTAQSTGRPRASAIDVMLAIASFLTFSPSVPGMSSPLLLDRATRPRCSCPAPCTARLAASVMNVPALAARPPARRDPHDDGHVAPRGAR